MMQQFANDRLVAAVSRSLDNIRVELEVAPARQVNEPECDLLHFVAKLGAGRRGLGCYLEIGLLSAAAFDCRQQELLGNLAEGALAVRNDVAQCASVALVDCCK